MKLYILTSLLFTFTCIDSLRAAALSGTQLEIGPAGSNQVSDSLSQISGAIGTNNFVDGEGSLCIGLFNQTWTRSLAVGFHNTGYASEGLTVGSQNINEGTACMLFGCYNYATMDYELGVSAVCLLAGSFNTTGADVYASFVLGTNNVVAGDYNY